MSEPKKKDEKETEIQEIRSRCKSAIPEILPLIEEAPLEAVDELADDLDQAIQAAGGRVKDAEKKTLDEKEKRK